MKFKTNWLNIFCTITLIIVYATVATKLQLPYITDIVVGFLIGFVFPNVNIVPNEKENKDG